MENSKRSLEGERLFQLSKEADEKHDLNKSIMYLEQAVELEHPRALNQLAICYLQGVGVQENALKALEYFKRAENLGVATAALNIGFIYLMSMGGVKFDIEKAKNAFLNAAELCKTDEELTSDFFLTLAPLLTSGALGDKYFDKEIEVYKAGSKKYTECTLQLSMCYLRKLYHQQAYSLLKEAAYKCDKKAIAAMKKVLKIGDRPVLSYSEMRTFMAVRSRFFCEIKTAAKVYKDRAQKMQSYMDMYPDGPKDYLLALEIFCTTEVEMVLDAFEDIDITGEDIYEYMLDKLPGVNIWREFLTDLEKVKKDYEYLQARKSARPNSYGSFAGGGKGIGGAIAGAITASLLNMATDAVVSTVNQVSDHNSLQKINNKLTSFYNEIVASGKYEAMFIQDCQMIAYKVMEILIQSGKMVDFGYKDCLIHKINTELLDKIKTAIDNPIEYKKVLDEIGRRIQERPFDESLYVALIALDKKYYEPVIEFMDRNKMIHSFQYAINPGYSPTIDEYPYKFTLE